MDKLSAAIGVIVTLIAVIFALSLILAFPVKWLWNSTMPELFSLSPIDWWMAWKLMMLSGFLFKSTSFGTKS